jgi:hypothetical protein
MANKKYDIMSNVIESLTLIKVEKKYNSHEKNMYFYNIKISNIEELLLLETNEILDSNIVGNTIEYKLNKDTGEIIELEIV